MKLIQKRDMMILNIVLIVALVACIAYSIIALPNDGANFSQGVVGGYASTNWGNFGLVISVIILLTIPIFLLYLLTSKIVSYMAKRKNNVISSMWSRINYVLLVFGFILCILSVTSTFMTRRSGFTTCITGGSNGDSSTSKSQC